MTLQRFISVSFAAHLIAVFAVFFAIIPQQKETRTSPLFAKLIGPDELGVSSPRRSIPSLPKTLTKPKTDKPEKSPSEQTAPAQEFQPKNSTGAPSRAMPFIPPGTGFSFPLKRDNLFDSEVIMKSAEKDALKEKKSLTFDTKEFKYYGYMQRLKEKVENLWKYPSEAAEKGIYGDLFIDFTIKKDGTLGSVQLVRTSGHRILDETAINALKEAAPFWPLPEEWKQDALTIRGHFIYAFYGHYVR